MNDGSEYSTYKQQSLERISRKTSNFFWDSIDFLSYKLEKFAQFYELSISHEYNKERELFDIKYDKKILHIGCGAYPITAITLARNNGVKVTAIDRNKKAVEKAKNIVHKKKLDKRITIIHVNGTKYPIERFDTIIISGCAIPRTAIFKHIFENAKSKSKIIIREIDSGAKSVIKIINLYQDINIIKNIKNRPLSFFKPFGWQSFYLIKK
jgi:precorrin-6B methylase 2